MKRIAVFGSTGSIGASLLDIVRRNRDKYKVVFLSSNRNARFLGEQAQEFDVHELHLFDEAQASAVQSQLSSGTRLHRGRHAVAEIIDNLNCDLIVNAIVGAAGLEVSYYCLKRGINLALANKESMVAGGLLLDRMAAKTRAMILPIDSEHSAIFQCLLSGRHGEIESIVLTSSGGPFRTREVDTFDSITPAEALRHPNWSMGNKITIDSATMMNKGLEVIEAHYLFNIDPDAIEVVVHAQSIVHSMIQFHDGALIAQLSPPDMRLPIAYALEYPNRLTTDLPRLNLKRAFKLDFEPPDTIKFPSLPLAYRSLEIGGMAPLTLNAANEIAVAGFLANQIKFTEIPIVVERALEQCPTGSIMNLEDLLEADRRVRERASELVKSGTLVKR